MKDNIFIKSTAQSNACIGSVMTGKARTQSNVITRVLMLLLLMFGVAGQAWAETSTVTASKVTSSSVSWTGSAEETWSVSVTGGATNQNMINGYAQIGTKNSPSTSVTFSTSGISGTITSIVINCASYQGKGTVSTTVGGSDFGTQSQGIPAWSNDTGGDVTFSGSALGSIVITMTNGSGGRAMYIKSITVTYTTGGGSLTPSDFTLTSSASVSIDMKDATTSAVTWTSSSTESVTGASNHDDVATFAQTGAGTGTITAHGTGNCTITLNQAASSTIDAGTATINVTVTRTKDDSDLTVTGSINLTIPTTQVADITSAYTTSSTGTMTYSASDDPSVALINSDGKVVAVGTGTAQITISQAADDSYLASGDKMVTVNVTGTQPSNFAWDLSTDSYTKPTSTDQVVWSNPKATMKVDKSSSGTNANSYLGGDSNNRTSSRFYSNSVLTFTPTTGYEITAIMFTATTVAYAAALANSTWTNAVAAYDGTKVVIIPEDGTTDISATISATTGHTEARIYYTGKTDIATLNSITPTTLLTGQTGTFTLDATYATDDPTEYTVAWTSSPAGRLTLSGNSFTANTTGDATVTVTVTPDDTDAYNEVSEDFAVTVEDPFASFESANVEMVPGERRTQTVTTNSGGTVTYTSNSENATVDSATGEVAAVSQGEATITATVAEWNGVAQQTASYTVMVGAASSYTYEKVTTQGAPATGVYLIVNEESQRAANGALDAADFKKSDNVISVTFDDNDTPTKILSTAPTNAGYIIIRELGGGKYSMKAAGGYYFGYDDNASNGHMNTNSTSNSYNTTITINSGSNAIIRGNNGEGYTLQYNASARRFAFYGSEQESVTLYRKLLIDPTASFAGNKTLELGDTDRQTVTTNSDGAVTYSSSDVSIVTVDATGNITAVGTGTATITANIDFSDTYNVASATYTVTVASPSGTPVFYGSENDVAVVAAYSTNYFIAMRTTAGDSDNRMTAKDVTDRYSNGNVLIASAADFAKSGMDIRWTKEITDAEKLKLKKPGTSNYLQGNNSTDLKLNTTATEWTWNGTNNYYYTTIGSTNRSFLYNGTTATAFRNYAVSNIGTNGYSRAAALCRFQYTYDKYNRTSTPDVKPAYTGGPILASNAIAVYTPENDDLSQLDDFKNNANVVINGTAQLFEVTDKIDYYAPTSFTTAKRVKYIRENTKGYNTVCLPFTVNIDKMKSMFGNGTFYTLTSATVDGVTTITFDEQTTGTITAGTPFLVHCTNDAPWSIDFNETDVTVNGEGSESTGSVTNLTGEVKLVGSYVKYNLNDKLGSVDGIYKLNSAGTYFVKATTSSTITPFRFYLDMRGKDSAKNVRFAVRNSNGRETLVDSNLQGDVNEDKDVSIVDLTTLVDILNGNVATTTNADVNGDGEVNQADVDALLKILTRK